MLFFFLTYSLGVGRLKSMNTIHPRYRKGFTIVELLIVIVIIGILAAISIVAYSGIQAKAYRTTVHSDLANAAKSLDMYKVSYGNYPTNVTQFRAANLKFSLSATRFAVYCARNTGDSPGWALVMRTVSGEAFYLKTNDKIQPYTGAFDEAPLVCDRVLGSDVETRVWLKSSASWSNWVVY